MIIDPETLKSVAVVQHRDGEWCVVYDVVEWRDGECAMYVDALLADTALKFKCPSYVDTAWIVQELQRHVRTSAFAADKAAMSSAVAPLDIAISWKLSYSVGRAVEHISKYAMSGVSGELEKAIEHLRREIEKS